ncbi:serine hydrolase [Phycicoccus sp. CSK15P-2]|uniref:serine hydrolase n=1 Tax=Phycicoccus sp. CSK15P-2 TaxID=2807627 RepID=UPI0027DC7B02|nr:serine hydrolase [Phycicoccus sp. CSK15P-2]
MERQLDAAGLSASLVVRDLDTRSEIRHAPDREMPLASLVKVPLALAVLDAFRRGDLDPAEQVRVPAPAGGRSGPGLSRFRHEATVSLEDLVYLAVCLSDNIAADVLFDRYPPAAVTAWLAEHGLHGIHVRHGLEELGDVPRVEGRDAPPSQVLATTGRTSSSGHWVRQLDVARANTGTARSMAHLMEGIWSETGPVHPRVRGRMRELLSGNVHHQRLWPDFASDSAVWASKTGTVLNLRHEVGVVEHADGHCILVSVLTESSTPAAVQPAAEAAIADACRQLHDVLRGR